MLIMNHKNVSDGYFSRDFLSSGIENADNPGANTYSVIGLVHPIRYRQHSGHFDMKLMYWYDDGSVDELRWSQKSWITEANVSGANLWAVPDQSNQSTCSMFTGLMTSENAEYSYFSGNREEKCLWNAVAVADDRLGGIPGFRRKLAYGSALYLMKSDTTESVWSRKGRRLLTTYDKYELGPYVMYWQDAENYCNTLGSHLASIHSQDDNDHAATICSGQTCWIGLNDIATENTFRWSDDSEWVYGTTYYVSPWNAAEPNVE